MVIEDKGEFNALGPFGMPFIPRIDGIAVTSVTDNSLGPKSVCKMMNFGNEDIIEHTDSHVRAIFVMEFFVANVVFPAAHDPDVPEFCHFCRERSGILVKRMER